MATVELVAVSKYFDKFTILNDIHLNIEKGEFVAIVGPSGSGKSTLLRLVAGLETVCSGNILINSQCMNKIPASKRNMAMVFQSYALYPHMTVYANMAYGLKMRGMKKSEIDKRVFEVADMLKLSEFLYRKPMSLSGGQRQRVAMGRAIVRSPAVFLFDEPLSNLDAKLRTEMRHEIKKLHKQLNATCIYVTHDQIEAMTLADRVVILNHGVIEQVGTPHELYNKPATVFVASFIGHYPMNFLSAKIDVHAGKIKTELGIDLSLPDSLKQVSAMEDITLGIRPEHMVITEDSNPSALNTRVEFVDDMGSDKLVQVITDSSDVRLSLRMFDEAPLLDKQLPLDLSLSKATVFCRQTGRRLGTLNG